MSHFYAEIQGNRGLASRQGTANSGIWGHIRGWNCGIEVRGIINEDGEDEFLVYATRGSNGFGRDTLIASITKEKLEEISRKGGI